MNGRRCGAAALTYLYGTLHNVRIQTTMTAAVVIVVAATLAALAQYDAPFSGARALSPAPWAALNTQLRGGH